MPASPTSDASQPATSPSSRQSGAHRHRGPRLGRRRAASAFPMWSRSATWATSISATCSTIWRMRPGHALDPALCREPSRSPRNSCRPRASPRAAKPVVVIKAGRVPEGAKAALSHTGALAGSDAVYDAAFRRAGILRVRNHGRAVRGGRDAGHRRSIPGRPPGHPDQWRRRRRAGRRCAGARAAVPLADAGARRRWTRSTRCCRRPGRTAIRSTSSATRRAHAMRRRSNRCSTDRGTRRDARAQLPDGGRRQHGGRRGRSSKRQGPALSGADQLARRDSGRAGACRLFAAEWHPDLRHAGRRPSAAFTHLVRYRAKPGTSAGRRRQPVSTVRRPDRSRGGARHHRRRQPADGRGLAERMGGQGGARSLSVFRSSPPSCRRRPPRRKRPPRTHRRAGGAQDRSPDITAQIRCRRRRARSRFARGDGGRRLRRCRRGSATCCRRRGSPASRCRPMVRRPDAFELIAGVLRRDPSAR